MDNKLKKEILIFYFSNIIYQIGRTIPHAFVTIYLLDSNLSISQITIAQMFFMTAVILFEIPSGLIADLFYKKKVYFFSCILISISYLMYLKIYSFYFVCLAQFLYGLAVALQSGTIDSLIINKIYLHKKGNIEKITKTINANNFISMLIGATLGTLLYNSILKEKVYILSIVFFLISACTALLIQEEKNKKQDEKNCLLMLLDQLKDGMKIVKYNKTIFRFIILISFLQFLLQPFYNYWQPISVTNNVKTHELFVVYILIQIFGIIGSSSYNLWINMKCKKILITNLILIILISIILICSHDFMYVFILLISTIPRTWLTINLKSNLQTKITNDIRSTVTSIASAIERFFSFFVLLGMTFFSKFNISLMLILFIFSILYVLGTGTILIKIGKKQI